MENKRLYECHYAGRHLEVQADTTFEAQQLAAARFGCPERKRYLISVFLVQQPDGTQVIHSTQFL